MDLRFALRSLAKNPAFTLLAVLVMALGIGANTAVFSVVNAVLLRPLPYPDPDRIVTIRNYWKKTAAIGSHISAPDYHDWRNQSTAFESMAYWSGGPTAVIAGGASEYAQAAFVTSDFFRVFGARPQLGRFFSDAEMKPGSGGAAVISAAYWRARLGANPAAIGASLQIYGKSLTIVGVAQEGFEYPAGNDVWVPTNAIFAENPNRSSHNYFVVGRLKPKVNLEQAQAQMTAIAASLEREYPRSNEGKGVLVSRMQDTLVNSVRPTLYILLGAVGVVLLIACANMANLLLARSTSRTREIAIRAAVGASRGRVIRQLIVESVVWAALAGAAGLVLAMWGSRALVALAPTNVPRLGEMQTDGWVLVFTLAISIASSLLFGLAPALQVSRIDLNDALKHGGARSTGGSSKMRNALVIAEIAFSVILLAGAGLLVRSFQALINVDNGYQPQKILVADTSVSSSGMEASRRNVLFYDALLGDLRSIPGVTAAAGAWALPGSPGSDGGYWIDHLPPLSELSVSAPQAVFSVVGAGYFDTLRIPLKAGRDFSAADTYEQPFVAVINESLAKKSFPGQSPVGRAIFCGLDSLKPMTIIGVAGDVRQYGPASAPQPEIYMPYPQHPWRADSMNLLLRGAGDPLALADAVRRKIREHSPEVPVKFTTMEAALSASVAAPRFRTMLLGIFALLALVLAMAGVYGVMAYVVGQKTGEIGLRMALGASAGHVARLVLGQVITLTSIGLAIGLAGAVAVTRLLTGMLFEVKPGDPETYAGVIALIATVALAAGYLPARRAARVDPLVALREE